MENRQLLEAAAKTARLPSTQWVGGKRAIGYLALESGREWNPLHDDGDAFRLLASVPLSLDLVDGVIIIGHEGKPIWTGACPNDNERLASARRAIVEAAAFLAMRT